MYCMLRLSKMVEVNQLSCVEYTQYLRDFYWTNWILGTLAVMGIVLSVIIIIWLADKYM